MQDLTQIQHHPARLNRRTALRVGSLSALGLCLADGLQLRTLSAQTPSTQPRMGAAKSCILIWLDGGPSHLETFDIKPDAPAEVRGPLSAISTSLPGVQIGECLPETAKLLNQVALIRSMTSPLGEHNFGTHYLLTGYKPTQVLEYPTFAGVTAHLSPKEMILPPSIAIPDFRVGGGRLSGGGYLPVATRPFSIGSDPAKPDFNVKDMQLAAGLDIARLDRRRKYVNQLDQFRQLADETGTANPGLQQAVDLISSPAARSAFELEQEAPELRRRYGPKTIGQSCLLARRLVERGVPFVTVNNRGWDTHNDLYTRLKEGYTGAKNPVGLIPSLDLALSGLVTDLQERGMLDETLVVVMGEFGRTPKLNTAGGRDHWPRVFSVALAGGGVRGGQVIGASDGTGESPAESPITPSDLAATIYTLLGIDPQLELHTADGRPVRLTPADANIIQELIG